MFKVNLSSFSKQIDFDIKVSEGEIFFDEDISINKEILIKLNLVKSLESNILVNGKITGSINVICVRCLEKIIYPIDTNFSVIFKKKIFQNIEKEEGIYYYEKNEIDFFDYIRETLLLELPIKPLCNENCKGLCPICGKNLNNENCNCEKDFTYRPFKNFNIK